jgi:hypothetical protein
MFEIVSGLLVMLLPFIAVVAVVGIGALLNPKPKAGCRQDREAEQNQDRWS